MDTRAADEIILAEIAALHRKLDALLSAQRAANPLTQEQCELLDATGAVLGPGVLRSAQILDEASRSFGDRPRLRAALDALNAHDVQTVGMRLAAIVRRGGHSGDWCLTRHPKDEGGSGLWILAREGD